VTLLPVNHPYAAVEGFQLPDWFILVQYPPQDMNTASGQDTFTWEPDNDGIEEGF